MSEPFKEKRQADRDHKDRRVLDLLFTLDRRFTDYSKMADGRHEEMVKRVDSVEGDIFKLDEDNRNRHVEIMSAIAQAEAHSIKALALKKLTWLQSTGLACFFLFQLWLAIMALIHR